MLISKPAIELSGIFSITLRHASVTFGVSLSDGVAEVRSREQFPQRSGGGPHARWIVCSEKDCLDEVFAGDKCLIHQINDIKGNSASFKDHAQSKLLTIRFQDIDKTTVAQIIEWSQEWKVSGLSFLFCDFIEGLRIIDTDIEIPMKFDACDFQQLPLRNPQAS
jgi:hypothetical protein